MSLDIIPRGQVGLGVVESPQSVTVVRDPGRDPGMERLIGQVDRTGNIATAETARRANQHVEAVTNEAFNSASREWQNVLRGENGLLNQTGHAAIDDPNVNVEGGGQQGVTIRGLNGYRDIGKRHADSLTGRARNEFVRLWSAREQRSMEVLDRHESREREAWQRSVELGTIANADTQIRAEGAKSREVLFRNTETAWELVNAAGQRQAGVVAGPDGKLTEDQQRAIQGRSIQGKSAITTTAVMTALDEDENWRLAEEVLEEALEKGHVSGGVANQLQGQIDAVKETSEATEMFTAAYSADVLTMPEDEQRERIIEMGTASGADDKVVRSALSMLSKQHEVRRKAQREQEEAAVDAAYAEGDALVINFRNTDTPAPVFTQELHRISMSMPADQRDEFINWATTRATQGEYSVVNDERVLEQLENARDSGSLKQIDLNRFKPFLEESTHKGFVTEQDDLRTKGGVITAKKSELLNGIYAGITGATTTQKQMIQRSVNDAIGIWARANPGQAMDDATLRGIVGAAAADTLRTGRSSPGSVFGNYWPNQRSEGISLVDAQGVESFVESMTAQEYNYYTELAAVTYLKRKSLITDRERVAAALYMQGQIDAARNRPGATLEEVRRLEMNLEAEIQKQQNVRLR